MATECNTLISYDAAQQADKSWGSTLMDCVSLSLKSTATFCWGRCEMVKHHYCRFNESPVWDSPCGGPSRALSGPAPSDTLDGSDNLHLSSWLSGLYCFRRSAAFTSSSSAPPRKPIFASAFRPAWFVTGWLYVSGPCKVNKVDVLSLMKGGIQERASNNEFYSAPHEAPDFVLPCEYHLC